jgi:hypothetical protein
VAKSEVCWTTPNPGLLEFKNFSVRLRVPCLRGSIVPVNSHHASLGEGLLTHYDLRFARRMSAGLAQAGGHQHIFGPGALALEPYPVYPIAIDPLDSPAYWAGLERGPCFREIP